jgi:hypothetical protein
MMTADQRTDALYAALGDALGWLAEHWPEGNGLCVCLKALPCPMASRIALYAQHLMHRIDYYGGAELTLLMPIVRPLDLRPSPDEGLATPDSSPARAR